MFGKEDLDNIKHLEFDEKFVIDENDKSRIIFGYNGIGKSSIYNYLKNKFDEYDFLDYKDAKASFIKKKDEVIIGAKIQTISDLKKEIKELDESNGLENILKKYGYTSKDKARINSYLLQIYNAKFITEFTIDTNKIKEASEILNQDIRKKFFDNYNKIKIATDLHDEIIMLKNNYLEKAYSSLIDSIDDCETTCPACNTEGITDLKKRVQENKKKFEESKKSIFAEFNFNEKDKEEKISQLIAFAKKINEKELCELIICDVNIEIANRIKSNIKEKKKKEEEISKLEIKLEEYYKNIKKEEEDIRNFFQNKFDIKSIEFDEKNKEIKVLFKRKIETYSEGELNLITLLFKLYEFRINDSELLIIDDPLTSYDMINQYKTLFEIINSVSENKKIIVFTHNIEMINIINSQRRGTFLYQYLERYKEKLYLKNININEGDSLLSLNSLLHLDKDNYLKLLIEREKNENDDYHKVFHYDEPFVLENDDKFTNMNNDYLADIIEYFDENNFENKVFTVNTFNKIIYMCAIRVWIERKFYYKLFHDIDLNKYISELKGKEFGEKIEKLFPRNKDSILIKHYPKVTRSFLMSKKVMLNQNEHYLSQILPFNYAMNVSLDDLVAEIKEIKDRFN